MKVAVFSAMPYDRDFLDEANRSSGHGFELSWFETSLNATTAPLAAGHDAVCVFVNDALDASTLEQLADAGIRSIALRCAGFNNVDLDAADRLGIAVTRVQQYSPHAVAEHTIALILCLNRNIHRAYNRVREGNFSLQHLLGFDLQGKTAGVIGTGAIGAVVTKLLLAFECRVLVSDPIPDPDCLAAGAEPTGLDDLLASVDLVSLHCPLTPETHHLIDRRALSLMRPGVMLINTGRGALIDTLAVIEGLKSGDVGSLGIDVYEEEGDLFFRDHSQEVLQDDTFARLLTFPNVLITGHQGFFTREAMQRIAATTIENLAAGPAARRTST
ncbi:MAG: 2-hydroxyacid dehydrogenase [Acidimicrobiales bacterium]